MYRLNTSVYLNNWKYYIPYFAHRLSFSGEINETDGCRVASVVYCTWCSPSLFKRVAAMWLWNKWIMSWTSEPQSYWSWHFGKKSSSTLTFCQKNYT